MVDFITEPCICSSSATWRFAAVFRCTATACENSAQMDTKKLEMDEKQKAGASVCRESWFATLSAQLYFLCFVLCSLMNN